MVFLEYVHELVLAIKEDIYFLKITRGCVKVKIEKIDCYR